jgi:ATP-dependent DNA ligase
MFRLEPCLPTRSKVAPTGTQWVHEIKHDGYRLMVRRTPRACASAPGTATTGPTGSR